MKKGFTLIELLAVIVILAIIALIAVPIILGIINTAREESNKRSIELYASAVKNGIALSQLSTGKAVKAGSYTSSTLPFEVEYDGDVECSTIEIYEDGTIFVEGCTVNDEEVEYAYGKNKGNDKPCTLEDLDKDGKASLSDIVTCGTESFYVMTNENDEITMLSMYNLYVGNTSTPNDGGWADYGSGIPLENPTNKQSKLAKGWIYGDSIWYGVVGFSSEYYWESSVSEYPAYVYNENSNLYEYVSEYERILKEEMKVNSAKTSLISYEQLINLGCDLEKGTCGPDVGLGALENPAPEWVYSTTYWVGFAYGSGFWPVSPDLIINFGWPDYFEDGMLGVRPVVTISASEI